MKIALILRDPIEYAVSRYLHLLRKGQASPEDISSIVMHDDILMRELDYLSMLTRFETFQKLGSLLIVPYSHLATDPAGFYRAIKSHLIGASDNHYEPKLTRVNVSRWSKWSFATRVLSRAAIGARRRRLHVFTNLAKSLRVHKLLEKQMDESQIVTLRESVSSALMTGHGAAVDLYRQIEKQFVVKQSSASCGLDDR
jgi:hypothetical protein